MTTATICVDYGLDEEIDRLDGRFLIGLADCENGETGKVLLKAWPPLPLTVSIRFEGLPHERRLRSKESIRFCELIMVLTSATAATTTTTAPNNLTSTSNTIVAATAAAPFALAESSAPVPAPAACAEPPAAARDFTKESARPVPAWVRDGVVYEIFPRAFSAGGDFNGVTAQLDRLRELGVTILWLMPIHTIGRKRRKGSLGSPYAVRDYYSINSDYGTKDELRRLVTETHRRDMKIIIDIVANHTAWDSVLMRTPEFYTRNASGEILSPVADWPDVADLNYDNAHLRRYMIEMLKFWVREFDLDGFRCDVAGMVPTDFWEDARAELDGIKPDLFMLAEWHEPDLLVKAFDVDYAWPFFRAVNSTVAGAAPATSIRAAWLDEREKFPRGSLHLRFSDNHDERRAVARCGERAALAASALMLTFDGVPLIYNGMEVGDTTESGAPALFERLPIFWPVAALRPEFPLFYREMIALRRKHPALRRGEIQWIRNNNENSFVTFTRRHNDEELLVAINFSNTSLVGLIEVPDPSSFINITPDIALPVKRDAPPPHALPMLALDAWEYRVYRRQL